MKKHLWRLLKWLAALVLIALIIWFNWEEIEKAREQTFEVGYLLLAGCIYLPCLVLTFYRWFLLVRAQDLPFREVDALRLGFIGNFFNQFLPGAVGGDLLKAGFLASEQQRRTVAVATVIVDRLVGLFGLMLLASMCGVFFWQRASDVENLVGILIVVWSLTATGLLMIVLPIRFDRLIAWLRTKRRIGGVIADVLHSFQLYRQRQRALWLAIALAVIGHFGFVLSYYLGACSVLPEDPTPSIGEHYMIIPIGMVMQALPLTPGNLGVAEAVFGYLYHLVGSTWLKGTLTCIAQRVVALGVAMVGLVFYIPLRTTVRDVIARDAAPEGTAPVPVPSEPAS